MYLDDVIMIGHTFQEHLLNLWKMFGGCEKRVLSSIRRNANFFRRKYSTSVILCHLRR
jgi:hypothetical protein